MGFIDDVNRNLAPINKAGNDFFGGMMKNIAGGPGGEDPYNNGLNGGGSADIGGAPQQASAVSPVPTTPGLNSTVNGSGADPSMGGMGGGMHQTSLPNAIRDAMTNILGKPAISDAQMAQAFSGLNAVPHPDYLKLTQDAFARMQDQVKNMQGTIDEGYNQAGVNTGDLYNAQANATRLGDNNIMTKIGQQQGDAIQGSTQNALNSLANLKNAELASRAAVSAKNGVPMAAGDNLTDLADTAATGMLANGQQQAANAQGQAADRTELNNLMSRSLGAEGASRQSALENSRLGYDASVGKFMTDLTNQETQREMDASKQNYQDYMSQVMARYNMVKDNADLTNKQFQAAVGSRGLPAWLQEQGTYDMNEAKAGQTANAAGNVAPAETALAKYPQFANAYMAALSNGMNLTPGQKPTFEDIFRGMKSNLPDAGGNDLIDFAQMAAANKAMSPISPYDLMMNSMQGQ